MTNTVNLLMEIAALSVQEIDTVTAVCDTKYIITKITNKLKT
jgi:hypothetical protein